MKYSRLGQVQLQKIAALVQWVLQTKTLVLSAYYGHHGKTVTTPCVLRGATFHAGRRIFSR